MTASHTVCAPTALPPGGALARNAPLSLSEVPSVAVVGTGVIGTSLALALRAEGIRTFLYDRDPDALATAEARGAGTAQLPRSPVDVAVIAVPPSDIADVLAESQAANLARVYTDVGCVKTAPLAEAEAMGCDLSRYVGGHPMAGSERSGPLAASVDLFRGKAWAITPLAETDPGALASVLTLVRLTGAWPIVMSHSDHDAAVARTSHVPHLVASILAASIGRADDAALRLCGAGIRDTTRIAAGDPGLWTDILRTNVTEVSKTLAELAADLAAAATALATDPAELMRVLERGNHGRTLIVRGSGRRE